MRTIAFEGFKAHKIKLSSGEPVLETQTFVFDKDGKATGVRETFLTPVSDEKLAEFRQEEFDAKIAELETLKNKSTEEFDAEITALQAEKDKTLPS